MGEHSKAKVLEKLTNVQNALVAPKNQFNSFGKYNYRSCEDILNGLKKLQNDYQFVVLLNDTIENVGDRIYVKATAEFCCAGTGESVAVTAWARESDTKKGMDPSQITGAASSYARKYALNGLFAIDDTKDADSDKPSNSKPKNPKVISQCNIPDASPQNSPLKPTRLEAAWKKIGELSKARWGEDSGKDSVRCILTGAGYEPKKMTYKEAEFIAGVLSKLSKETKDEELVYMLNVQDSDGVPF